MKQLIFIIILSTLGGYVVHAQTSAVTKFVLPSKPRISLQYTATPSQVNKVPKGFCIAAPVIPSFLHLNAHPVIKIAETTRTPVLIFTEFSLGDVLENSMNGFKANLVNTYDNHIPELFSDAPSLFKIKYIISL